MSKFEIVLALLSFVYALALTHVLQGLSDLFHERSRVRWSAVHGAWVALATLTLINNWLALIPIAEVEWSNRLILLNFAISALQYFTCSLIMPRIPEDGMIDLDLFQDQNAWAFITPYLLMLIPVIGVNFYFVHEWSGRDMSFAEFLPTMWSVVLACAFFGVAIWRHERWLRLSVPLLFGGWRLFSLLS